MRLNDADLRALAYKTGVTVAKHGSKYRFGKTGVQDFHAMSASTQCGTFAEAWAYLQGFEACLAGDLFTTVPPMLNTGKTTD